MGRVLTVCTTHHESGNATAGELAWLLGRLRPQVIFLEHSADELRGAPHAQRNSLELAAVARYREQQPAEVVPVGLHIEDVAQLKPAFDAMFDTIGAASPRYCELDIVRQVETAREGHAFLNSPDCAALHSVIDQEVRATLDNLADPELGGVYKRWTDVHRLRESALLRGVEDFARRRSFDRGVLLVGAAHWQSLAEEARRRVEEPDYPVVWEFNWDLGAEDPDADARPDNRHQT